MKKLLFIILLSVLAGKNLFAQCGNLPPQINFKNGSFEDTPKSPAAPSDWSTGMNPDGTYNITPDVQPIPNPGTQYECAIKNPASHGNTYVSMMKCGSTATDGPQEYITQQLSTPLQKGITYKSAIDLMGPKNYWLRGDPRTNSYCIGIQIWAGFSSGAKTQLLFSSVGATVNDNWVTTEFTITPNDNYTHFSIYAVNPASCNSNGGCAFLCMDNLKDLKPTSITAKANDVTCYNAKDGTAQVTSPTGTGFVYEWKAIGSTFVLTGQTISNLPPGKYTVIVKSGGSVIGCDTVVVEQPSEIVLTPTQTDLKCFGDKDGKASLSVKGGKPGYTYTWAPNTTDKTASVSNLAAGVYTCTVTDTAKCTKEQVFTIKEPAQLKATATATDVTIPKGSDGTATANPTGGTEPYTYSWNTTPTAQTTQTAVNLKAGTYTCVITDKNNCTTEVTVTIKQPSLVKVKVDTVHVICYNGNNGKITLTITEGEAPFTYKWSTPNGVKETATDLTAGTYTCEVTDNAGAKETVVVTIRQPLLLTVTTTVVNNLCYGNAIGEATAIVKGGTAPYRYTWTPAAKDSATITELPAGTYTCLVTDKNNCTATATATITQPPALTLSFTTKNVTCFGAADGEVTLRAKGGAPYNVNGTPVYIYSFNKNTVKTDSVTFKNLAAGAYNNCTVTDSNGCAATVSFVITEPGPVTIHAETTDVSCKGKADGAATAIVTGTTTVVYTWLPGSSTNSKLENASAGDYMCYITYNGSCKATLPVKVREPEAMGIVPFPEQTICMGQSITLTALAFGGNIGGYTYVWDNGAKVGDVYTVTPQLTATYTVVAKDKVGCTAVATATVGVGAAMTIENLTPATICAGDTAKLTAKVKGGSGAPYNYTWSPQVIGSGQTVQVSPSSTQQYTVSVKDNCGTPAVSTSVTITVLPKPVVDFTADTLSGCAPLCTKFTADVRAPGDVISEWTWDFGDKTGDHTTTPQHTNCFNSTGTFNISLTVKSTSGCRATFTKINYISTSAKPVPDFSYSPDKITMASSLVNFKDLSNGTIKSWNWNFDDKNDVKNNSSTLENPSHVYADTGTYCITLNVRTDKNCENKTVKCLRVLPDVKFYIPNAFTPNNDNKNQEFYPVGEYIKDFEMLIYDRWGMLIFYSNASNKHWNGSVNNSGDIVPIDVYVYKIQITDTENQKHELVGTVTVMR